MFPITILNKPYNHNTVYIGRGSIWGNPYPITPTSSRAVVIDRYKTYFYARLHDDHVFKQSLIGLFKLGVTQGQLELGCYCAPQPCHGDIIKAYLEDNFDLLDAY